jgi:hypothetical protein
MLGHGGVPWPFVRRSRFIKELERQGEAYRQNVRAAEADAAQWRMRYNDAEDEFRETVRHLQGYYDQEHVLHQVQTDSPDGVPEHFMALKVERDVYTDAVVFRVRVSRMMLERCRDLRIVYETVLKDLVAGMMQEATNPTLPGGKT